ncbi:hypothetical protein JW979_03710, partial [bacterium]|nr:hypothetical protein [candidate division CSSED10-310 bacterium]
WNRYAYCRGNPVNYVDPDGRETIFVFGTWGKNTFFEYIKGNPHRPSHWKNAVVNTLQDIEDIPFTWSGGNTRAERTEGAVDLFLRIRELYRAGRPINIVAHSHGGNLVTECLNLIDSWNEESSENIHINNIILIGTPIRDDYPVSVKSVGRFNLIYNTMDLVQNEGGYNRNSGLVTHIVVPVFLEGEYGHAERRHSLAHNIYIDDMTMMRYGLRFWQYRYAHSMPKENVPLWNDFIVPRLSLEFPDQISHR